MEQRTVTREGIRWSVLALVLVVAAGCSELFPKRTPGEKLYRKECADCHGVDGGGQTVRSMGNPDANLLDNNWRYAGDPTGMETVILDSLVFEHPTFDKLSPQQVRQVVDHILTLRGERRQ